MCMVNFKIIPKSKRKPKFFFKKLSYINTKSLTAHSYHQVNNIYTLGKKSFANGKKISIKGKTILEKEIIHGWNKYCKFTSPNAIFQGTPVVISNKYGELGFRSATPIAFLVPIHSHPTPKINIIHIKTIQPITIAKLLKKILPYTNLNFIPI